MEEKSLLRLDITELRTILLGLSPDATIEGRGITKKVLARRIIQLNPPNESERIWREGKYLLWCATLERISSAPITTLTEADVSTVVLTINKLYRDYKKMVSGLPSSGRKPLTLLLYLYRLTQKIEGSIFSNHLQLLDVTETLASRRSPFGYAAVDSFVLSTSLRRACGSIAVMKDVVGIAIVKEVRKQERKLYRRKKEKLRGLSLVSLSEAIRTMTDMYCLYKLLTASELSYDNFLTQLAWRMRNDESSDESLITILATLPQSIKTVKAFTLTKLYGSHSYSKEFLGKNALITSQLGEEKDPCPYVAILIKNGEIEEVVGIYYDFATLSNYLPARFPDLDITSDGKRYKIGRGIWLVIRRSSIYR